MAEKYNKTMKFLGVYLDLCQAVLTDSLERVTKVPDSLTKDCIEFGKSDLMSGLRLNYQLV